MKKDIQEIIKREVKKLDELSQTKGLDLEDCRRLDLLIKAYKSFVGSTKSSSKPETSQETPESMTPEELLNGIQDAK